MYRIVTYSSLFLVTVLLQVFLFDNLSVSIYLNPLIYVAFIVLLPVDTAPVTVLLAGLAMGVTLDFLMGAAGQGIWILPRLQHADIMIRLQQKHIAPRQPDEIHRVPVQHGGAYLGHGPLRRLRAGESCVAVHHAVFFSLEALSWSHIVRTVLRIVASGSVTVAAVWLLGRIFTAKFVARL